MADGKQFRPSLDQHLPGIGLDERDGTIWRGDWIAGFCWVRREGHFAAIPGGPLFDLSVSDVVPHHLLAGFRVYKQFFDSVPREFREAAQMDGAGHFKTLFHIYLPMIWGITSALAITTFIGAWNSFLRPFLAATGEATMTVPVGITQVKDAYGIAYARQMASAVMAGLPVAVLYLIFQRRVTQAIMLSAGVKG